ncbi:DUF3168 domain-containing protein [Mesorhizobium sp. CN2-181]|uniref:DUF3168 domain-containing protein n=1 Tax=Mesorhizobium yinganensis TaxID=3157707 RepID=UPI0032B7E4EC
MIDASYEIQIATVARLKGSAGVVELIDQRVYDDPPRNSDGQVTATFPYLSFGPTQILPDGWDCQNSSEVFLQLDAWSRKPGFAEVKKIAGSVRSALHKYDLPLTENALVSLEHDSTRILRDPDGKTSHAVVTFKAVVEHD